MNTSNPNDLLARFFGESGKTLLVKDSLITGYAQVLTQNVAVIGTCDGTYIDNAAALRLASLVIDCIENHPQMPIVMLVDSAGQEPSRTCEMLGLASYFGHLLSCLQLARQNGHKLITIATGKAIGGAFICYGMFGDRIEALDSASVGLMPIEAMSAVTKIPEATLTALSKTMPALEFGAEPFALLGGVGEVWSADVNVPEKLADVISSSTQEDHRAELGKKRGGRKWAFDVQNRVLAESAK
jgi:malonate decarboxylase gamma subunit